MANKKSKDTYDDIVVEVLEKLLQASKDYETTTRITFEKLGEIPPKELKNLKESNPKIQQLLTEYETIYERINKEI